MAKRVTKRGIRKIVEYFDQFVLIDITFIKKIKESKTYFNHSITSSII